MDRKMGQQLPLLAKTSNAALQQAGIRLLSRMDTNMRIQMAQLYKTFTAALSRTDIGSFSCMATAVNAQARGG